ncbi:MAG: hypothetical protein WC415_04145 [Patescibacteria group bacterium]|jgi:hypothetical protein
MESEENIESKIVELRELLRVSGTTPCTARKIEGQIEILEWVIVGL